MNVPESKDPLEVVTLTFPYVDELGTAELSSAIVSIAVVQGVDATPANVVNGAPQIAPPNVLQSIKAGVAGVRYRIRCLATLSDGRKLIRSMLVDVKDL